VVLQEALRISRPDAFNEVVIKQRRGRAFFPLVSSAQSANLEGVPACVPQDRVRQIAKRLAPDGRCLRDIIGAEAASQAQFSRQVKKTEPLRADAEEDKTKSGAKPQRSQAWTSAESNQSCPN
jgi:hypothetical protein